MSQFGGPYSVDFKKVYKPVFIVFIDLCTALTVFVFSIMWYWCKLHETEKISKIESFIPIRVVSIWFILTFKFVFDVFFLKYTFGIEHLNRSKVFSSFYWARIWYDVTFLGGILVIFTYFYKVEKVDMMSDSFKLFVIILPKIVMECIIYKFCVLPAYRRAIYQKYSSWRKGQTNPRMKEKQQADFFERMQKNFMEESTA